MIFNRIELNGTQYDITGQLRIKEDNEVKIIFDDLMFGNALKDLYNKQKKAESLILKNSEETRYDTKNVLVSHLTIDGEHYHATFK
ncbi:hypothetical protein [Salinicoccus sp. HZC-1]|uniref:hypothetical protein n=1 Tax=Salinicoccus sp. HZC-1 TaxID=3385497 RepID=UPI00398ABB2E